MFVVADLIAIVATANEIRLLQLLRTGVSVSVQTTEDSDVFVLMANVAYFGTFFFSVVAFGFWIHRSYANLGTLGVGPLRFSPGWAVGSYFVPIMNWFRPYQVMAEIWRATDPRSLAGSDEWQHAAVSPVVGLWWASWIIGAFVGGLVSRVAFADPTDFAQWVIQDQIAIGQYAILLVSALLAIAVVRSVTRRLDRKASDP